jgi:hypothetical protein
MGPGGAWALDGAGQNIHAAAKMTANRILVVVLFVLNCISRPLLPRKSNTGQRHDVRMRFLGGGM